MSRCDVCVARAAERERGKEQRAWKERQAQLEDEVTRLRMQIAEMQLAQQWKSAKKPKREAKDATDEEEATPVKAPAAVQAATPQQIRSVVRRLNRG